MSEKEIPNAEKTAAVRGMSTRLTPASRAAPAALIGPAPPNASKVVPVLTRSENASARASK